MNEMLSDEAKSQGIRYVFAMGSMPDTKKIQKGKEVGGEEQQSFSILG